LTSGWAVGLVLLLTSYTAAAQVTLAWDASVSMADGYWLYYGPASGIYTARLDVGTATTYTITGLASGQTYYFVATAYDRTDNVESPFSNEVSLTLPSTQPPPAGNGGGGGCTLNPHAGYDPLGLGMTVLWLAARVWTRVGPRLLTARSLCFARFIFYLKRHTLLAKLYTATFSR
jgi:hypothetical protein